MRKGSFWHDIIFSKKLGYPEFILHFLLMLWKKIVGMGTCTLLMIETYKLRSCSVFLTFSVRFAWRQCVRAYIYIYWYALWNNNCINNNWCVFHRTCQWFVVYVITTHPVLLFLCFVEWNKSCFMLFIAKTTMHQSMIYIRNHRIILKTAPNNRRSWYYISVSIWLNVVWIQCGVVITRSIFSQIFTKDVL